MSEVSNEVFGAKWAAGICLALIAGLVIVTGAALYDEHRLAALEQTESNTAVGDKALYPLPGEGSAQNAASPIVQFNGAPLYATSFRKYEERDSRMIRKGVDDSKHYSLYATTEPVKKLKDETAQSGDKLLFLKVGPGEYLKLKAQ
jgi:hypothetical protein